MTKEELKKSTYKIHPRQREIMLSDKRLVIGLTPRMKMLGKSVNPFKRITTSEIKVIRDDLDLSNE